MVKNFWQPRADIGYVRLCWEQPPPDSRPTALPTTEMMEADNNEIELIKKKEAGAGDAWSFESVPPSALNFEAQFPRHEPYQGMCVWY